MRERPEVFYNSISEVIFHNFFHVLSVRREVIGSAHTEEQKVTHGCGQQEKRSIESPLKDD